MKLFSIKTMLGMAAVGGAVMYVRKQGGLQKAFDNLMGKKDELFGDTDISSGAQQASRSAVEPIDAKTL